MISRLMFEANGFTRRVCGKKAHEEHVLCVLFHRHDTGPMTLVLLLENAADNSFCKT